MESPPGSESIMTGWRACLWWVSLHLLMQPLLTGDSAVSFSDRELQDLLSLPVSELFLRGTTGPDPRLSGLSLGPAGSDGALSPPGPSGSLPESLLVRLPFRLSEDETWLIWPSSGYQRDRQKPKSRFLHESDFKKKTQNGKEPLFRRKNVRCLIIEGRC